MPLAIIILFFSTCIYTTVISAEEYGGVLDSIYCTSCDTNILLVSTDLLCGALVPTLGSTTSVATEE